uniref:RING-type E3 ubiquitin transferase n=1 Tax=Oryza glumipatula TaxID=40148 RepID=A0A0E0B7U2_9ORYZ
MGEMDLPICIPHMGAHNPRISGRGKCTKTILLCLSSTPPRHSSSPPPAQLLLRRRRRRRVKQFGGGRRWGFVRQPRSLVRSAAELFFAGKHQQNPASTIVAIDKNLDTSTPDTYRAPPTPLPYDVGLVLKDNPDLEKTGIKRKIHEHKESLMMDDNESLQKCVSEDKPDEEDVCPICLEEYDEENPRSMTKCEHHFHLCCILEWMERSETCPVCDQITMINAMYE